MLLRCCHPGVAAAFVPLLTHEAASAQAGGSIRLDPPLAVMGGGLTLDHQVLPGVWEEFGQLQLTDFGRSQALASFCLGKVLDRVSGEGLLIRCLVFRALRRVCILNISKGRPCCLRPRTRLHGFGEAACDDVRWKQGEFAFWV